MHRTVGGRDPPGRQRGRAADPVHTVLARQFPARSGDRADVRTEHGHQAAEGDVRAHRRGLPAGHRRPAVVRGQGHAGILSTVLPGNSRRAARYSS